MAGGRSDAARGPKQFVDFQNDVAASDILLAAREGFESVEHVKRYTAMGFGTDQGKLGNINGMAILAQALGKSIPETGTTTYRPNYTPVRSAPSPDASWASSSIRCARPACTNGTPGAARCSRTWATGSGPGTTRGGARTCTPPCAASAWRCNGVGILDASTLGKIDIQGPDAVALLNWMYTNPWGKLEIGKCRYGLMLDENGMVFDDGVTTRLGEHHFMMTTTTGGAARVLSWMERWLQTEWPQLKVRLASVTDHWATFAVAGPKSRAVLRKVCGDIDFSNEAFPFMSYRDGLAAGVPARVMRISFSGERAYEVNVPANAGRAVWEALMAAGEEFGITPYGTETMHVLRAEKGYIIVGQDTDGSVTPQDLGMGGLVAKTKDCLGKRSLARSDTAAGAQAVRGPPDRGRAARAAEGAQIVERDLRVTPGEPTPMIGHVTSSYYSPILRRSIALALVRGGLDRMGERVEVSLADGRGAIAVIASPVFYDAQGSDSMRSETDMVAAAGTARLMLESPLVGVADLLRAQEGASTRSALRERAFLDLVNVRGEPSDAAFVEAVAAVAGLRLPAEPTPWRAANVTTRYGWGRTNGCCVRSSRRRPAGCMRACPRPWPAPTRRRWTWAAATRCWKSAARRRARRWPVAARWTCTRACSRPGNARRAIFQDGDRARTHGRRAHGSGRAPQLRRLFLSHPARRRGALARMNSLRDAPRDVLDDADARAWARGWTVFVDGYTVAARIGLYPHEHLAPQPIVIDARLGCLGEPDEDGVWIDYDGFCARVAAFLAGRPHTRLLETLVADLAALSFQTWPALAR